MMIALFLLLICFALPAWAQERGWEREWNEVLAAAKKEGTVMVAGPPNSVVRRVLPAKFTARFGIPVEYLGRRTSQTAAKVTVERRVGINTIDVFLSGSSTSIFLHQSKVLDPVKPILLLPGVVDPSKWKKGKLWFIDPQGKHILRLLNYTNASLYLNTDYVKPEEIKFAKDLLNPKWKGKISAFDPTTRGGGTTTAAKFLEALGEEFVRKLYIDQQPIISRNTRQLSDWLGRGVYPISLDGSSSAVRRMKEDGIPVKNIYGLPDLPVTTTAGTGFVLLVNRAPHPNAARVFINWMASKEGLEVYARAYKHATTRNDIDEASFLLPEEIPRPGANYFDTSVWDFSVTGKLKVRSRMKEILKLRSR